MLVVEDGTGTNPTANSYGSVQEWKDFWTEVGYDFSAYADPDIEVALVRAARYIEVRFRNCFYGWMLEPETQPLAFPRYGFCLPSGVPVDGVPINLKKAQFEYAKRALPETAELMPDPADTDATGMVIRRKSTEVGPIKKSLEYAGSGARQLQRYPAADKWLEDFMPSGGGVIRA